MRLYIVSAYMKQDRTFYGQEAGHEAIEKPGAPARAAKTIKSHNPKSRINLAEKWQAER
jgi:hypothetical protein